MCSVTSPRRVPQAKANSGFKNEEEKFYQSPYFFNTFPKKERAKKTGMLGNEMTKMLAKTCRYLLEKLT